MANTFKKDSNMLKATVNEHHKSQESKIEQVDEKIEQVESKVDQILTLLKKDK